MPLNYTTDGLPYYTEDDTPNRLYDAVPTNNGLDSLLKLPVDLGNAFVQAAPDVVDIGKKLANSYVGQGIAQTQPAVIASHLPYIAQSTLDTIKYPGEVWKGEKDPLSDEGIEQGLNLAGMVSGSTFAAKPGIATLGSGLVRPTEAAAPVFYSAVEHAINQANLPKASGEQWLGTLSNKPGVKPEELEWLGLKDWLREQKGPVTKQAIKDYVEAHKVELGEVDKGDTPAKYDPKTGLPDRTYPEDKKVNFTKYSQWQLHGGENYREKLLTLPAKEGAFDPSKVTYKKLNEYGDNSTYRLSYDNKEIGTFTDYKSEPRTHDEWTDLVKRRFNGDAALGIKPLNTNNYTSSHWSEPNIISHVRMNDRTIDGQKALHLEEIQSDWHQTGRDKGYKLNPKDEAKAEEEFNKIDDKIVNSGNEEVMGHPDINQTVKMAVDKKIITPEEAKTYLKYNDSQRIGAVPDAPFKKSWLELSLKRMIREAAEKGYDKLSWTPGAEQAARYDLSKQVNEVSYNKEKGVLQVYDHNHNLVNNSTLKDESELSNYIGKDAAKKLLEEPTKKIKDQYGDWHILSGLDLKVGGEGMYEFYDKMLPRALEKIGKEYGVKVKEGKINIKDEKLSKGSIRERPIGGYRVEFPNGLAEIYSNENLAEQALANWKSNHNKPIKYIDIPQGLKDSALQKGFPLFSSGSPYPLIPVAYNPFENKKKKYSFKPVSGNPFK